MQLSPTLEDSLNRTDGSTVCTSYMYTYWVERITCSRFPTITMYKVGGWT